MAKTVGSDFLLLNKTIIPKYKNVAYNALATHAPVASASLDMAKMSLLLPREDSNLEPTAYK